MPDARPGVVREVEESPEVKTWDEFFSNFSYKPDWHFECTYDEYSGHHWLSIWTIVENTRAPGRIEISNKIRLFPYNNEDNALSYVRHCIYNMAGHEMDENILYKGEMVFDPHRDNEK